jgi:IS30 family transposase
MKRQRRKLTVEDRVAIDLRRKDGWGVRAIARELGRSPSVISAEIGRGCDTDGRYAAGPAQAAAAARGNRSGRKAKLAPDSPRFAEVAKLLRLQWSPEQIAGRRKRLEDGADMLSGLRVSHEAIYQAIYAVPRGELRRELLACQGKPHRGRRSKDGDRRGRICDMTSIRERPAAVEGARTLGGRPDQGGRQPLLGRHAGRAHQPQAVLSDLGAGCRERPQGIGSRAHFERSREPP